jgi:hypothetical protein
VIVKRSGSYGVKVYDPATKQKRWMGTFATLREARRAERDATSRKRSSGAETCAQFADRWLIDYARSAPASQRTYHYALQRFKADFATTRLSEVDKLAARTWARSNPQSNVRTVRAMFTDAINDGLHPGPNPFGNLRLEQSRGRKDLIALTEEELLRPGGLRARRARRVWSHVQGSDPVRWIRWPAARRAVCPRAPRRWHRRSSDSAEPRRDRPAQAAEERADANGDPAAAGTGRADLCASPPRCALVVRDAER